MRQWGYTRLISRAAGAGGARGDHRVIEHGLKDRLLAIDVQAVPLMSELPAGAHQLVDPVVSVAAAISRRV